MKHRSHCTQLSLLYALESERVLPTDVPTGRVKRNSPEPEPPPRLVRILRRESCRGDHMESGAQVASCVTKTAPQQIEVGAKVMARITQTRCRHAHTERRRGRTPVCDHHSTASGPHSPRRPCPDRGWGLPQGFGLRDRGGPNRRTGGPLR